MPLVPGDQVAILPSVGAAAGETLEIALVTLAGPVFVQLADLRMFSTADGRGLNNLGCIVRATEEHRAALDAKLK